MYTTRPVMKRGRGRPQKEETVIKQNVIQRLIKNPDEWAKHVHVMREIYAQYPDNDFWKGFNLGFKLNSFYWFKTELGKNTLQQAYRDFKKVSYIPAYVEHKVDGIKYGEDKVIERKPATIDELFK